MAEKQQMPPSTASFKASGTLEEVWLLATSREDEEAVRIAVADQRGTLLSRIASRSFLVRGTKRWLTDSSNGSARHGRTRRPPAVAVTTELLLCCADDDDHHHHHHRRHHHHHHHHHHYQHHHDCYYCCYYSYSYYYYYDDDDYYYCYYYCYCYCSYSSYWCYSCCSCYSCYRCYRCCQLTTTTATRSCRCSCRFFEIALRSGPENKKTSAPPGFQLVKAVVSELNSQLGLRTRRMIPAPTPLEVSSGAAKVVVICKMTPLDGSEPSDKRTYYGYVSEQQPHMLDFGPHVDLLKRTLNCRSSFWST